MNKKVELVQNSSIPDPEGHNGPTLLSLMFNSDAASYKLSQLSSHNMSGLNTVMDRQ